MEAAKSSIKNFISKDGHHDTKIHERVAPAVQQETVNRTQHDEATTAVDREVHQDHYHTTEQPVYDKETLPEQHHHNLLPTQERSFEHDDSNKVKERLAAEQSQYKNTQTRVEGEHSQSVAPSAAGEHVHHHVYETVQPVVQKQTIEPHVVHTTQPIHEVHHNAAQHHSATALPAVSMDEFKKQGGSLGGRDERKDRVDGCPPDEFHPHGENHSHGHRAHDSGVSGMKGAGAGAATGAFVGAAAGHRRGSKSSSSSSSDDESKDKSSTKKGALGGAGAGAAVGSATVAASNSHKHPEPASYGNDMHTTDSHGGSVNSNGQKKASLLDKLNPKKDSDGDGVSGFMK